MSKKNDEESLIIIQAKPVQPRFLKYPKSKLSPMKIFSNNKEIPINEAPKTPKTRSHSFHDRKNSQNSHLKLPSLFSNNTKYFMNQATLKSMKKNKFNLKCLNLRNPSYIL